MGAIPGVVSVCHIDIKVPSATQRLSVILLGVGCLTNIFRMFRLASLGLHMIAGYLNLRKINNDPNYFPSPHYHIVGDSAFGLQKHLMIPFKNTGSLLPGKISSNT